MQAEFAGDYESFQKWHWWFRGRELILCDVIRREWRSAQSASEPRSLISVGSGPPNGFAWLRSVVGPNGFVLGLDADPSGVLRSRAAADRAGFRSSPACFAIGEIERPPLEMRTFDLVVALDVIEHLEKDIEALRHASRLVSSNGLLVVTVPACPSLWGEQDVVSQHKRRYSRRSLLRAFDEAGLRGARISYFNTLLFPLAAAVRWTRRLLASPPTGRSDFESGRPGLVNDLLASVFSAEKYLLRFVSLPIGVSLVAVWRPEQR